MSPSPRLELTLQARTESPAANVNLADLGLGVAQVAQHLGPEILIELYDLQLELADAAAGAGDFCDKLSALAFELGLVALQLRVAHDGHEVALEQVGDAPQLLADEFYLDFLGLLLSRKAADLLVGLRDALARLGASLKAK